jgi:hypothetical protein
VERLTRALHTGERMTRGAWGKAWRHSRPTLVTANPAALVFVLAPVGMVPPETTIAGSRILCIAFLLRLGARVVWALDRTAISSAAGGLFAGGLQLLLAMMK